MHDTRWSIGFALLVLSAATCVEAENMEAEPGGSVQAQVILTVSEGKRLIAKAVAEMPIVKKALQEGMVIVARGTTNTYVAEELTGKDLASGAYVIGWTGPAKGGKKPDVQERAADIVLVKGAIQQELTLAEAVKQLKAGDVVIKGANALDYEHKAAGVLIGSGPEATGGTTGSMMGYVTARKAHLVIPVGLEKEVAGSVLDIAGKMREPVESLNTIPSMFLLTGTLMTEIEALELLAGVSVFQAASGGIGGAEGGVRLICRGSRENVQEALRVAESVQGEPPFLE